MNKKVFVLSTGRSGTNYISNKIEALKISSENVHQDKKSRRINILSNLALKFPQVESRIIKTLDKNPSLLNNFIDPLKSMAFFFYLRNLKKNRFDEFEEVTIIHLVRDPRNFVRSFMNWKNRKISGRVAHHMVPFWMPKPQGRFFKNLFMSKFEHYCWTWEIKNRLFHSTFKNCHNYHLIKFEDLVNNDQVFIEMIEQIYNIQIDKEDLNQSESIDRNSTQEKIFPHWKSWDRKKCQILDSICGYQMNQYGYGKESDWLLKIKK